MVPVDLLKALAGTHMSKAIALTLHLEYESLNYKISHLINVSVVNICEECSTVSTVLSTFNMFNRPCRTHGYQVHFVQKWP